MSKILLAIFGLLVISGSYLYYQSEFTTFTSGEPPVLSETHELEEASPTPTPNEASERALRASVGLFLLLNEEQGKVYLEQFSEKKDAKEAITNLALFLDSDNTKLNEVENLISSFNSTDSYPYTDDSYSNNYSDDSNNSNWSGSSYSDNKSLRYNSFNNSWEYAGEDERLKYNAFENDWEYASDDELTRYNAFENRWEFAGSDESTKYNAFENTWEYAPEDSTTRYNAFENKWEITSPDSSLKYNAFENTWSYE